MSAEEEFKDRRREDRIGVMVSVEIDLGGAVVEATALDMSLGGISVWAPEGIKPIAQFTIKLTLDSRGPITLSARLAREFESDGGAVWGIAWVDLPPEKAARIESFLESK